MTPEQRAVWDQLIVDTRQRRIQYERRLRTEDQASMTAVWLDMLAECDVILVANAELQRLWAMEVQPA